MDCLSRLAAFVKEKPPEDGQITEAQVDEV
jgi:hypothetical protein